MLKWPDIHDKDSSTKQIIFNFKTGRKLLGYGQLVKHGFTNRTIMVFNLVILVVIFFFWTAEWNKNASKEVANDDQLIVNNVIW